MMVLKIEAIEKQYLAQLINMLVGVQANNNRNLLLFSILLKIIYKLYTITITRILFVELIKNHQQITIIQNHSINHKRQEIKV